MSGQTIVTLLLGLLLGVLLLPGDSGLLLGPLAGWLVGDHLHLRRRLTALEQAAAATPRPERPAAPRTDRSREDPTGATLARPDPVPVPAPPPKPRQDHPATVPPPPAPPRVPGPIRSFLNWLAGGNLLVRVGMVLLFFGIAFLLKYVSRDFSLPLELRFAGTALFGLALLALGWRLRQRRPGYAMVVQGGGVGVLYLTVFVATRFALLPPELAFALLVALALLSALLALGQDAPALALFGAAGGFLAPVLAASGSGSHVQLFSYYAVLNAGILGIAWRRNWRSLNLLGFVFTFVIAGLWGYRFFRPQYFSGTQPFLVLFFLLYTAVAVLAALRQPLRLRGYVDGPLVFGLPVVAFGLQAGLVREFEFGLAWSAIALGAFYLTLATALWRRHGPGLRLLCEAFLAMGVVFLTLAVPLAVDGRWTAAAWALEGAALVWVGRRQDRPGARISGLLLQLLAGGAFALGWERPAADLPLVNGRALGGLLIALAGLFSAWYLDRGRATLRAWERPLPWLPLLWGLLWWYGTGLHEIDRFLPPGEQLNTVLLLCAASAALATLVRHRLDWRGAGLAAALLLPVSTLLLAGMVVSSSWSPEHLPWTGTGTYHPLAGSGWPAWLAVFVVQYLGLYRLEADFPGPGMRRAWHAGSLWLLAWVLTWELARTFHLAAQGQGSWALAAWGAVPAGLALWVQQRGPRLLPWPVTRWHADYLCQGVGPLWLFVLLWSLPANLSRGDSDPLTWLPLLNPLDLAMAFAVLGATRWWLALGREPPRCAIRGERLPVVAGLAAAFLWLNAALARAVHHLAGVAFDGHALLQSGIFQSALSLLWSGLALVLMAWSARHGRRRVWLAGAVLLGLVVSKLFLVELADSGTLTRIVSFLGVGGLLLLVGYLAPLPPREHAA
jgi:uncharacterized membrane protein